MLTKACPDCGLTKPLDEFYKRANGSPRNVCKVCWCARSRTHQRANPEKYREYGRRTRAKQNRYQRHLRQAFGLTPEQHATILASQGGACAICHGASGDPSLHVDHDHETAHVRGILCGLCNRMLGQSQDDSDRLRAGAAYLDARRLAVA